MVSLFAGPGRISYWVNAFVEPPMGTMEGAESRNTHPGLHLVVAQLSHRLQRALRRFERLTDFSAVAAVGANGSDSRLAGPLCPPVHPECAKLAGRAGRELPCPGEWRRRMSAGRRARRCKATVCPLGLRCVCVPIRFGDHLLGLGKFVAGGHVPEEEFARATGVLELLVTNVCQSLHVSGLTEEVGSLRRHIADLQQAKGPVPVDRLGLGGPGETPVARGGPAGNPTLMSRVLEYLSTHYKEPDLCLSKVAQAAGVNDKYLAHFFVKHTGQRMHPYINELRVRHACELLLETDWPVKRITRASGFSGPCQFRRSFQQHVGVTATDYRRIFASVR